MPDASAKNVQLVGSVLERIPGSTSSSSRSPAPKAGFPPVEHRTKSAFARSRDLSKTSSPNGERPSHPPLVVTSERLRLPTAAVVVPPPPPPPSTSDDPEWREDVGRENEKIVASMSPEEREVERREVLERFGPGVGAILQKAKRNREMRLSGLEGMEFEREVERVPGSPGGYLVCVCRFSSAHRAPLPSSLVPRPNSPTGPILRGNVPFTYRLLNLTDKTRNIEPPSQVAAGHPS